MAVRYEGERHHWGLLTTLALGVVLVVLAMVVGAFGVLHPVATVDGVAEGELLRGGELHDRVVTFTPRSPSAVREMEVLVDGQPVSARQGEGSVSVLLRGLTHGEHEVTARLPGLLFGAAVTRKFTVDERAPVLAVDRPSRPDEHGRVTLRGTAKEADKLLVHGSRVALPADGSFSVTLDRPPGTVEVTAADQAGHLTVERVRTSTHPGMRAVHLTAHAWTAPGLREPVLDLLRAKRIDTVQLDIKDESGLVGYATEVATAKRIGAVRGGYDARAALRQLHELGARVVGRLVAFRDPVLGAAAWRAGHHEQLVQRADGGPWTGGYGLYAFTNPAHPEVRRYNIELAAEAAGLGFDDILFDYVRRPDGPLRGMRFPGATGDPTGHVTSFVAEAASAIRAKGGTIGVSVFGIAARHPEQVAQDIPALARHVDYVAPMVYPSHWGRGEYGVGHPEAEPYEIVKRSIADFRSVMEGSAASVIPWLQDFSLKVKYGPGEVRAQIRGAKDAGAGSFLLWNAGCRYQAEGLG
ncbi:putative glycoside hydrolase [Crossiella sp. CA-258035]|uniref:putative glycoside hydrolase n=1 Tax=Crossiella sp. CA-258035 TaxID=2981138 RepID=UPI0024BC4BD3|nr:putative glycoside hydrolase [Crossiella sp. CA-258035]WHT22459.1 putative glycoside hydrolase [Crossiella sp. CA-258035]